LDGDSVSEANEVSGGEPEKLKAPKLPPQRPNPPPIQRGRAGMLQRRAARIRTEIERNRTEGPKVPTWVLAVALAVILGGWIALIVFS
jgi:hypothetical protein